ncbi:unnamed protein product [Rhodiola kirilowii]
MCVLDLVYCSRPGQGNVSDHPSDHTKIWSELSGVSYQTFKRVSIETGSAAKNGSGTQGGQAQDEANVNANPRKEVQGISAMHISKPDASNRRPVHHMDTDIPRTRDNANNNDKAFSQSQHHPGGFNVKCLYSL